MQSFYFASKTNACAHDQPVDEGHGDRVHQNSVNGHIPAFSITSCAASFDAGASAVSLGQQDLRKIGFRDWLLQLDGSGQLLDYQAVFEENYDTVAQLPRIYVLATKAGKTVDELFFEDIKVARRDHRRIFLDWFQRECGVDIALAERDCLNGVVPEHTPSFYDWLLSVDPSKVLLMYLKVFENNYDTVAQVIRTYTVHSHGSNFLDARMFEDVGIRNIEHQRRFQVWFERCDSQDVLEASLPLANGHSANGTSHFEYSFRDRTHGAVSHGIASQTFRATSTSSEFEAWALSHHLGSLVVALREIGYDELDKLVDLTHESLEDLLDAMQILHPTERAQLRRAVAFLWAQEMGCN